MAASMKSIRLLNRLFRNSRIQHEKTFCCSTKLKSDENIKQQYRDDDTRAKYMLMHDDLQLLDTVEEAPPKETFPHYVVSTEEFKYVEKLLPKSRIPDPPSDMTFPTPSGWVPPNNEKTKDLPYSVERSKNHSLPVYIKQTALRGLKITTIIKNVHGDIWQFEEDLRNHVESMKDMDMELLTEVSEVTRRVTLKGNQVEVVGQFLLEKGF